MLNEYVLLLNLNIEDEETLRDGDTGPLSEHHAVVLGQAASTACQKLFDAVSDILFRFQLIKDRQRISGKTAQLVSTVNTGPGVDITSTSTVNTKMRER